MNSTYLQAPIGGYRPAPKTHQPTHSPTRDTKFPGFPKAQSGIIAKGSAVCLDVRSVRVTSSYLKRITIICTL
jgi:hypothetical protein